MGLVRRQGRPAGKAMAKARAGGGGGGGTKKAAAAASTNNKGKGKASNAGPKQPQRRPQDIYEYADEDGARRRRPREDENDGNVKYNFVAGGDDEEIDEDGAFDSEDEKRYGDLMRQIEENDETRRKRKRGGRGRGGESEEEEDDEDMDADPEEGEMSLSDMLGGGGGKAGGGKAGGQEQKKKGRKTAVEEEEEEEEELGEGEDEEEEVSGSDDDGEEEDEEEEDEEEDEDGDHDGLMDMIAQLAATQQQQQAASSSSSTAAANHALQSYPDSLFATGPASGLTMEAMLKALEHTKGYSHVRKRLSALVQDGKSAIQAPAPSTVQARAERSLVYKEKKKDVETWLPLVSSARQAESLNFAHTPTLQPSQAALIGKFAPETDMEKAVHDLLVHAKADKETAIEAGEAADLEARGITAEQVKIRRAELAKMRALLFYEQQKRHQANKIKSKAYHRIRKRQRLRVEDSARENLRAVDPAAARKMDEEEAAGRAQERMTLRHKNTSKWAKQVLRAGGGKGSGGVETRRAVTEQILLGEQLRRKAGMREGGREGGSEGGGEEDDESEEEGLEGMSDAGRAGVLRKKAAGKVRTLLGEVVEEGGREGGGDGGLMGMKFMTRAVEKQRAKAQAEVEEVLRELEQEAEDEDEDEDEDEEEGLEGGRKGRRKGMEGMREGSLQMAGVTWGGQGGRVKVVGPITVGGAAAGASSNSSSSSSSSSAFPSIEQDVTGMQELRVEAQARGPASFAAEMKRAAVAAVGAAAGAAAAVHKRVASFAVSMAGGGREGGEEEEEEESNPWMVAQGSGRSASESAAGKRRASRSSTGSNSSKSLMEVQRAVEAVMQEVEGGEEDEVEEGATGTSTTTAGGRKRGKRGGKGKGGAAAANNEEDMEQEEEEDDDNATAAQGRLVRTKEQAELVRRAFASVDVEGDFAQEKADALAAEEEEAEAAAAKKNGGKNGRGGTVKANEVAGWGNWAGMGAPALPPPPPPAGRRAPAAGGAAAAAAGGGGRKGLVPPTTASGSSSSGIDKALTKPRLDRALPTVVINERRMKKAAALKVTEVPYPFTSREQYERSLRRPVGKEWNTALAVREQTRPAVKVRAGVMVQPIKLRKTHRAVFPG